jgi:hypothetical protein
MPLAITSASVGPRDKPGGTISGAVYVKASAILVSLLDSRTVCEGRPKCPDIVPSDICCLVTRLKINMGRDVNVQNFPFGRAWPGKSHMLREGSRKRWK